MEKEKYEQNARQIFDLVEGMTHSQWKNINELIEAVYREKEANTTFEKTGNIDLLITTSTAERAFTIAAESIRRDAKYQSLDCNSFFRRIMSELSEKDLHCIARILQGCIYTDGDMFHCCKYCNYGRECTAEVKEKHTFHFDRVREKLQDITGVYLSIGSYDIEKKFLLPTKVHVEKQ